MLPRFAAYYDTLQHLPRRLRRSLQRQWKQSLAGVALLLTLGQAPALAATINVNGGCTLINAITAANSNAATNGCPAGDPPDIGADTIVLPPNSLQILTTVNNVTHGPNGLPVITSDITINGQGSTISRPSTAPAFRIFEVYSYYEEASLTLQQTTISGGKTTGSSGLASFGGGIGLFQVPFAYPVTLALSNSTITGNSAIVGGGVGSYIYDGAARVTMTNSTVSNNLGTRGGGFGFSNARSGHTSTSITGSTFTGNHAAYGGGIFFRRANVSISNSTLSGNSAPARGGAVFNDEGLLNLIDSTVTGNTARINGGGITNQLGSRRASPGRTTLTRSIVSGNTATSGPEIYNSIPYSPYSYYNYPGVTTANNFNILGQNGNPGVMNNFTPGPTDIVPSGPVSSVLNTTLANNGGPTLTHNLTVGGPAVDAAGASCSATDQRGVTRPGGPACDVGAVELVTCNGRAARVGTSGNNFITGTAGVDVLHGLGGNDTLKGLGGNDLLCGGGGNDTLKGGLGNDLLNGDQGNDILRSDEGNDLLNGGLGDDALIGGAGVDRARFPGLPAVIVTLNTSPGTATGQGSDTLTDIENLTGSDGGDMLTGNAGPNQLTGGSGDDLLFGLAGIDNLDGGLNFDICYGGGPLLGDTATPECDVFLP